MSVREAITRLNLIIKKVRKCPATFKEIQDFLKQEGELKEATYTTCKRTFQRDIQDILDLYDIEIRCNRRTKVYYIESEDKSQSTERILEAFDVFNALKVADRLSGYIHFENRRTGGTENLHGLLHSIQNRKLISFSYQKFWDDLPQTRQAEPLAVKEFKNRWYLLANDLDKKELRVFALDRLTNLVIRKTTFTYPDHFDVQEYYKHSFGIIHPTDQPVEDVVLSFTPDQGKYIKSLPLHESQQILVDTENEFRVRLNLHITFDFVMEILSYGHDVKVIEPSHLVQEIVSTLQKAIQQYNAIN